MSIKAKLTDDFPPVEKRVRRILTGSGMPRGSAEYENLLLNIRSFIRPSSSRTGYYIRGPEFYDGTTNTAFRRDLLQCLDGIKSKPVVTVQLYQELLSYLYDFPDITNKKSSGARLFSGGVWLYRRNKWLPFRLFAKYGFEQVATDEETSINLTNTPILFQQISDFFNEVQDFLVEPAGPDSIILDDVILQSQLCSIIASNPADRLRYGHLSRLWPSLKDHRPHASGQTTIKTLLRPENPGRQLYRYIGGNAEIKSQQHLLYPETTEGDFSRMNADISRIIQDKQINEDTERTELHSSRRIIERARLRVVPFCLSSEQWRNIEPFVLSIMEQKSGEGSAGAITLELTDTNSQYATPTLWNHKTRDALVCKQKRVIPIFPVGEEIDGADNQYQMNRITGGETINFFPAPWLGRPI